MTKYNLCRAIIYFYLVLAFLLNGCYCLDCFFCKFCCALFFPDLFPVPTLITVSAKKLLLTDIDNNNTIWELSEKANVKDVCYIVNDDKAYYIVEDSLFLLDIKTTSKFQVFHCSFPFLREYRKICGHYCIIFGLIMFLKKSKLHI